MKTASRYANVKRSKLDFKNYLGKHFSALNTKSGDLKKVPMSKYKTIFEETEDLDYFPTLFDWNAMKEIDFLSNSQLFTPNELKENQHQALAERKN